MSTEYRVVPVEPTEEMIAAVEYDSYTFATGDEEWIGCVSEDMAREIYMNMLAAAPVPPAVEIPFPGYPPVPEDRKLPPAGGEPEVVIAIIRDLCETEPDDSPNAVHVRISELESILTWHVTRLQAEVERLTAVAKETEAQYVHYFEVATHVIAERDALKAELRCTQGHHNKLSDDFGAYRDHMESELTKARELLREGLEEFKDGDDWIDRVVAVLGTKPAPATNFIACNVDESYGESAPAAKDGRAMVTGTICGGDAEHNTVNIQVTGAVPRELWTIGQPVTLIHGDKQ